MRKPALGIFCFILFLSTNPPTQWQYPDFQPRWDVPYVPTPHEVVNTMLDMADVRSSDILYDLGCGDGRIVITAAQKYRTKGIGIDIDPERIADCHKNAAAAEVEDLVMFVEQDLFEADIREASVVTLYLLSSINLKLRPKLFQELKPGTRIVSHDFSMGDWSWDNKKDLYADGKSHNIYFWVLPANVTGTWKLQSLQNFSKTSTTLLIDQQFQKIRGKLHTVNSIITLEDARIQGDQIEFMVRQYHKTKTQTWYFKGLVKEHTMQGEVRLNSDNAPIISLWRAERNPATKKLWETEDPLQSH